MRLTQDVFHLLQACLAGKSGEDYIFTRPDGTPVRDFREAWSNLCCWVGATLVPKVRERKRWVASCARSNRRMSSLLNQAEAPEV